MASIKSCFTYPAFTANLNIRHLVQFWLHRKVPTSKLMQFSLFSFNSWLRIWNQMFTFWCVMLWRPTNLVLKWFHFLLISRQIILKMLWIVIVHWFLYFLCYYALKKKRLMQLVFNWQNTKKNMKIISFCLFFFNFHYFVPLSNNLDHIL